MDGRTLTWRWRLQDPASLQGLSDRNIGAGFVRDQQASSSLTLYLGPALSPWSLLFGFIISVQKFIPLTLFYQRYFLLCCSGLGNTCTTQLWISQNTDLEPHVSKTPFLFISLLCLPVLPSCALEEFMPKYLEQLSLQNAAFQKPFLSEQKADLGKLRLYPK